MTWTSMIFTSRHIHVLLCLGFSVHFQGQTSFTPFFERMDQWQTQDTAIIIEEHRLETKKLQASRLLTQELLEWAETAVLLQDKEVWNQNFAQFDSLLQIANGPWETHLEHFHILYSACRIPPPDRNLTEEEKARTVWDLFSGQLTQSIGQLGKAPIRNDASQFFVVPPSVISWNSASLALLLSVVFAFAMFWQVRRDKRMTTEGLALKNPLLLEVREQIINEMPNPERIIQIDLIEFKLGLSPIQVLSEKDKKWSRLNHSDLTLLHLILRGHSMAACAEFTGKTQGHVYNQRSKLRKHFGIPPETKLSNYIEEAVVSQS